jgi:hypothetical protein
MGVNSHPPHYSPDLPFLFNPPTCCCHPSSMHPLILTTPLTTTSTVTIHTTGHEQHYLVHVRGKQTQWFLLLSLLGRRSVPLNCGLLYSLQNNSEVKTTARCTPTNTRGVTSVVRAATTGWKLMVSLHERKASVQRQAGGGPFAGELELARCITARRITTSLPVFPPKSNTLRYCLYKSIRYERPGIQGK